MERRDVMTRFLGALVAVALLAGTGCYATVRGPGGPEGYPSARHGDGDDHHGNQGRDEHAKANHGGDGDHD
jgi:hypothetical protein